MSIVKKHIIRYYTIVEVMVAMSIFVIMMTIMMQFFNSAQKVWSASSKRNMMYADARVAMNLMTREIQSMLYRNDAVDSTGIYPFWLEWTETNINLTGLESIPADLEDHWVDNNDLPEQVIGATPKDAYLTALNFIATTDIKSVEKGSNICEIRYKFVPAYYTDSTPESANDVKGGYLQRSCVEEYYSTSQLTNLFRPSTEPYNFLNYPYQGDVAAVLLLTNPNNDLAHQQRVATIWSNLNDDNDVAPFRTVIAGVYSLKFTCYVWNSAGSSLTTLTPMNRTAPGEDTSDASIAAYDLATGTPAPIAIRVDMKLLDPKDLKKLIYYIFVEQNGTTAEQSDATRQIKTLKQKMRSFSKVIYIGQRD